MIIAQISDTHITLGKGIIVPADVVDQCLQRAVKHLLALPTRPDLVLVSGDLVDNGALAEYARFQELIRPLPMPVYVVPGNHDDRAAMLETFGTQGEQALPGFVQYVLDRGVVRIIALDTNVPGHGYGLLNELQLEWLDQRLSEAPNRPTLIFMHHPPFSVGLKPYEQIGLEGADAFSAIIARHSHVERVVTGHIHMALSRRFAGTTMMSCPSTAQTLLPDMSRPEQIVVHIETPACLIHAWSETGGLNTFTSTIAEPSPLVTLHNGVEWQ